MNGKLGFHGLARNNPLSPANAQTGMKARPSSRMRARAIKETERFLARELGKGNRRARPAPREARAWCLAPGVQAPGMTCLST